MKKNKTKLLVLLLFIAMVLFLMIFFKLEPDYFWHVKAGEYMFNNGVLTHDVFSWSVAGKYWMSHEWLFEIILYSFKLVFGNIHSVMYCFVSLMSLFLIVFITNRKKIDKNVFYTLMFMTLFVVLSFGYIQARPHMISFSLLALSIYLLYDLYNNEKSKKIYFLPLIAVLWANVHGGSSNLSYILCAMFIFSGLFSFNYMGIEAKRISKKQIYKYLLVMVLCIIGICINIHGFKMLIYPYENMLDTTMLNNINEWKPTSLTNIFNYSYFLFIIMVIVTMIFSDKKMRFIDILLFGFMAFLGIKSIRFWLYCPIAMSFVIFDYFDTAKMDKITNIIVSIFIIVFIVVFASNINRITNIDYKFALNKDVIKLIKKEKPRRLFNMYNYGGELVYNDILVFVDGRADLYSKYNYKDYLNISNGTGNYIKLIDKYDFDYLLVDKDFGIYNYLNDNDKYEVIYKKKKVILYKKIVN